MNWIRKIEPLIDHVIIGLFFILLGFNVVNQLNESSLGFIGIIAILWGCFKLLIGVIIYGVYCYAIIFNPESLISIQEKRQIRRIKRRIEDDLSKQDIDKAINRLHFLTFKYPNRDKLKDELAKLYLKTDRPISAGRQLFFKRNTTIREREAVELFKNSNGNNAFQILRRVINPRQVDIDFLRANKHEVLQLLQKIETTSEKNSWIVKNLDYYLQKVNMPFHKQIITYKKDTLINCFALVMLLILQILTK